MSERRKFTDYEKKYIYSKYNGRCAFCGSPVSMEKMTMRHRIPLSRGGTNAFDNLDLSCRTCNFMIGSMTFEEFARKMHDILNHKEATT